jgi:hypothetical protein
MLGKNFDGHGATEPRVRGPEHMPHPAGADLGIDAVRS